VAHRGAGYRIVFFLAAGMALAAFAVAHLRLGDPQHALIDAVLAAVSLRVGIHSYAEAREVEETRARRSGSSSRRSI
jgi:hypothetical protein